MRIAANCALWAVTTVTDVHCTFAPTETRSWRLCTCLYYCIYCCVVTVHQSGLNAHMNGNLALSVYKNKNLCFALSVSRSGEPSCFSFGTSSDDGLPSYMKWQPARRTWRSSHNPSCFHCLRWRAFFLRPESWFEI